MLDYCSVINRKGLNMKVVNIPIAFTFVMSLSYYY